MGFWGLVFAFWFVVFGGNTNKHERKTSFRNMENVFSFGRAPPLQVVAGTDKQYQWVPKDFWMSTPCTAYVKGFFLR